MRPSGICPRGAPPRALAGPMPLKLITGPANAGKAELLLGSLRARAAAGERPWLVVPTTADVRHYRRELACAGAAIGLRVAVFPELAGEMARRAGVAEEALDGFLRERLIRALVSEEGRRAPAPGRPGEPGRARGGSGEPTAMARLAGEVGRVIGELESAHVDPQRLREGIRAWRARQAGAEAATARAAALADLFDAYLSALAALGVADEELRAARATDALRAAPHLWCERTIGASVVPPGQARRARPGRPAGALVATPVSFYGFDDLTPAQLDAIETLAVIVDAPVAVTLAYEPGRVAFAERARAFQSLLPWAGEHVSLPAADRHYAPAARAALGHLERRLFEGREASDGRRAEDAWRGRGHGRGGDGGAVGDAEKRCDATHEGQAGAEIADEAEPREVVRLLEGASERAELELVAEEALALVEQGMRPQDIVVVHRRPEAIGSLATEVFGAAGLPLQHERGRRFGQTALGGGFIALLRCSLGEADADDLVRWLRTPGVVRRAELVDRLEREMRARGAGVTAQEARELWEAHRWPLESIDRVREAAARGPLALLERLEAELWNLFTRPRRGEAALLQPGEDEDATSLRCGLALLARLRDLVARASSGPAAGGTGLRSLACALTAPAELVAAFTELPCRGETPPEEDTITLTTPLALRARRVRALFVCGLQEGTFPAPPPAPAYLDEEERRALALAGVRLDVPGDAVGAERYLLYACVSRPEEVLVASWHVADDEGNATPRSLFVDDLVELFGEGLLAGRRRRVLASIASPPPVAADPPVGAGCAMGLGALVDPRVLAELGGSRRWSPSGLECFAACPVRWFVERFLRPAGLDPEAEQLAEGAAIHAVLKEVLEGLRRERSSARLDAAGLGRALELMRAALALRCAERPLAALPEIDLARRRRLQAQLERYLREAAGQACELEPAHFELAFGFEGEEESLPSLDLGEGVRVRGRIDRIDVGSDGEAVVYDYKRSVGASMYGGNWLESGTFQIALYMRAAEALLGATVVGGVYQPITGADLRPRGILADGAPIASVRTDRRDPDQLRELVEAVVGNAREAALAARAGRLGARPQSCAAGGCAYPAICGCER
jgi:hypothetical protein